MSWLHARGSETREEYLVRAMQWLIEKVKNMAKTLDEILAQGQSALAKATANTDTLAAIKTLLDADVQAIKDLKAQLDAAGTNATKLQALSDTMDALVAQADTQAAAEAAIANTPAE